MRVLFCVVALSTTAALLTAQERVPAQPDPVQPKVVRPVQPGPAQPGPPPARMVPAPRLLQLEEEVETAEAARDVKKAHVRAAEVAVRATERAYAAIDKAVKGVATPAQKVDLARAETDVEMAKAQLEVRVAELREIEVKVKFAKKRLDEAKAVGARPAPGVRPVPVDPVPERAQPDRGRGAADDKAKELDALKAKLVKVQVEAERAAIDAEKAELEARVVRAELERILDVAMKGRVAPGTIEKAKDKEAAAQAATNVATKKLKELKEEIAKIEKEIEKLGK
jgi:hypothetical protein